LLKVSKGADLTEKIMLHITSDGLGKDAEVNR
jgi:hypothetical protein